MAQAIHQGENQISDNTLTTAISSSQPSPAWKRIILFGWVIFALVYLAFFLLELRLDFIQILSPCQGEECNYNAVSPAEASVLEAWGLSTLVYASIVTGVSVLNVGIYWLLGGLILWRQGASRIGLAVSLALLVIPITIITDPDNLYVTYPRLLIPVLVLATIGSIFVILFVYLFPNGRLYPRWAAIPLAGAILLMLISQTLKIYGSTGIAFWDLAYLFLIHLGIVFQVFRYRRGSTPVERQQTKWTLFGFIIFTLAFPVWFTFFFDIVDIPPGTPRLLGSLGGWLLVLLMTAALPITLAIAILRYRLWDIDVIIRRTLVYGALTATLALVFFGGVAILQRVVGRLTGTEHSPVAIVISTLMIAALFSPLRRRIQDFIDRRFYRRKYNAEQALEEFAETARNETDLDALTGKLVEVVNETMQPESVRLWLRPQGREK